MIFLGKSRGDWEQYAQMYDCISNLCRSPGVRGPTATMVQTEVAHCRCVNSFTALTVNNVVNRRYWTEAGEFQSGLTIIPILYLV